MFPEEKYYLPCSSVERAKALDMYGEICDICHVEKWEIQVHHVKARSDGGDHRLINLQVLCCVCHYATEHQGQIGQSSYWRSKVGDWLLALASQCLEVPKSVFTNGTRGTLVPRLRGKQKTIANRMTPDERLAADLRWDAFKELRFQARQIERSRLTEIHRPSATFSLGDKLGAALECG